MPSAEGRKLSELFRTKNAGDIKDALSSIVAEQADIVDEQLRDHKNRGTDDMDPELMKNLNSVFANGTKLHNIIAPKLPQPGVNVNIGIAGRVNAEIGQGDPRGMASFVIKELQASLPPGTPVTDDMVRNRLLEIQSGQQAIEGEIVE